MQGGDRQLDLRHYLWVMHKHRRAIVAFAVALVSLVTVYSFTARPVYKGTARVMIEKEAPNIVDFKEIYAVDSSSQEFFMTQQNIIMSRLIARKAMEKLGVGKDPAGGGAPEGPLSRLMFWKGPADRDEASVNAFLDGLKVEPVRGTRLIDVSYESGEPAFAAEAANAVVMAYNEHIMETRIEAMQGAADFLTKKIEEQRKKLEESELLLHQYQEGYNIVNLGQQEEITAAKLAELNTDVLRAENERVEAEMRFKQAKSIENKPDMIESIPRVLANPLVTDLKAQESELTSELSELSKKYGEKHPKIITLTEKLRAAREGLNKEIKKVVTFLKNEYEVALAKEETMKRAFEGQKAESQRVNKQSIAYGVLQRDVETNKQMYEILLTRLKQASISGSLSTVNVRVIDKATVPQRPVRPQRGLNILLSVMLGVLGGAGMALLLEHHDNTVKTPDDLARDIRIPYLGPVPAFEYGAGAEGPESPIEVHHRPRSVASEAYRAIRTAIVFSSAAEKERKTILLTSAAPSEGKSLTSANLAAALAQSGYRTLLVDADLRRPRIHSIFGLPLDNGFSNLIVGRAGLDEVVKKTEVPRLDVITCGQIPPNPAELFGSKNARTWIEALRERYDKVVFDSSPVLGVTDPVILGTRVDMVVFVIMAGKTPKEMVRRSVEQMEGVGAWVAGAVINNVRVGKESYYYYNYNYHYSAYTADEEAGGKGKAPDRGDRLL